MAETKGKKAVLVIMDGVGLRVDESGNAVTHATTPNLSAFMQRYPTVAVQAAGASVGMDDAAPGSSEAGHMTLGTGQMVDHPLRIIAQEVMRGTFMQNQVLAEAFTYAKERSSKVHLVGILSDADVHAGVGVVTAIVDAAKQFNYVNKLYLHIFLDGRDTSVRSGQQLVERLYLQLRNQGYGTIATMIGRNYAMMREKDPKKMRVTLDLLLHGKGESAQSPLQAVIDAYGRGETDEALSPIVVDPDGTIGESDTVICYNERADRMRPLYESLVEAKIAGLHLVSFVPYAYPFNGIAMYQPPLIEPNLTSVVTGADRTVHKITEADRYAHLTYFFDGRKEDPYEREVRTFVDTVPVAVLTASPKKAVDALTKVVLAAMHAGDDCIVVNYPYGDTLGHAGEFDAAIAAVSAMDEAVGSIVAAAGDDYVVICTADHGNCEYMHDEKMNEVRKEDTANPVWCICIDPAHQKSSTTTYVELAAQQPTALLPDVTATVLTVMGITVPPEMTGLSLLA